MTENINDPASSLAPAVSSTSRPVQDEKKAWVHINLDPFGLSKLWTMLPKYNLTPNQIVFIISLVVFLTYAIISIFLKTPIEDCLPVYVVLAIVVFLTLQASIKKK